MFPFEIASSRLVWGSCLNHIRQPMCDVNENDIRQIRLSRRRLVATGVGAGVGLLLSRAAVSQPAANPFPDATADELLDAVLNTNNPELAIDALVTVFARSGIAVFDDEVTQPLVPPTAPISPLSFQRWQLSGIVSELAMSGRPASSFHAIFPATTEDGIEVLTVGEMIAGYYGGGTTPGSDFTRAFLNRIVTQNMSVSAEELPAPTAIVSLLGGEILGQLYEASTLGSSTPLKASETTAETAMIPFSQAPPGINLPGLPEIPAIPNVPVPPLPSAGTGVCSAAQSFIATVQQRLLSVLQTAPQSIDVPVVREIVQALALGVQIGIGYLLKTVNILLAPVMNVLKTIGAGLAIASQIVGTISPWTVSLDMRPAINRFGVGGESVTGEIEISAGGWDRIDLPAVVVNCANVLNITLPKPTAKDAPVSMWVSQPRPLLALDQTNASLDDRGRATVTYVTSNETVEEAKGTEAIGIAWITATVEREDLKRLRDQLFNLLFSQLPAFLEQVIRPLIGPTATAMSNELIALASVKGTQPLYIIYHERREEPEPPDQPDDDETSDCLPGTFQVADPAVALRMVMPGPAEILVQGGRYIMDFRPGGIFAGTYETLTIAVSGGPVAFTYTFNGTQGGTYTTSDGILTVNITSDNVTMTADIIAVQGEESGTLSGQISGPYSCGNPVVWQIGAEGFGTIPYELIPIG